MPSDPSPAMPPRRHRVERPDLPLPMLLGRAVKQAYDRSQSRGDDFPMDEVVALVEASDGRCALTGLAFSDALEASGRCRPWVPTLDRIDPMRGYVQGNVRFTCWIANRALGDFGDEVFWRMIEAAYRHRNGDAGRL